MFIYTAKLNKKKAITVLCAAAAGLIALIVIVGQIKAGSAETKAQAAPQTQPQTQATQKQAPQRQSQTAPPKLTENLNTNSDRVSLLNALGWQVKETPLETAELVIPTEFTGAYEVYAELQKQQGFDLAQYGGAAATRYTYSVLNYPTGETGVVADIIVCGAVLIAGDVQSPSLNGFMSPLFN